MRLTYYGNACCVMEAEGFRVLTDPWLVDGAYEGSWRHYPPLTTRPEDLAEVDALFISNLRPDHFDARALAAFRRDIPILVLDHGSNALHAALKALGFTKLVKVKDGESGRLGPFEATLYAPFHDPEADDDCAAVFEADGAVVMNFNDNTPDFDTAEDLRARHGRPTVAQIAYGASGAYPSCFENLNWHQKAEKSLDMLEGAFTHAAELARILAPKWHMPFAGGQVIGGRQWWKNHWLGAASQDVCGDWMKERNPDIPVLLLNEGQSLDLKTGRRSHIQYQPIRRGEELAYIEEELAGQPYPYDADPAPSSEELIELCQGARAGLWARQEELGLQPNLRMAIRIGEGAYCFDLRNPDGGFVPGDGGALPQPFIAVGMDPRLLRRILTGQTRWAEAELGCHIDFLRQPDVAQRDLHALMGAFVADGREAKAKGKRSAAA